MSTGETTVPPIPPVKKKYVRAVSPRLRKLLYVVFALVALLAANSGYLASITALEWRTGRTYQNFFYQYMFLGHLVLGLLLIVPLIVFGTLHMLASKDRRNRRAVRVGYALFAVAILVLISGLLLMRIGGFDLKQPQTRTIVYWMHVITPLAAGWLYWLHRLTGPKIKWKIGLTYAGVVGLAVLAMVWMHSGDPRAWNAVGPESGVQYFEPSLARTASGDFIPAEAMMNDDYCKRCHPDVHAGWESSVHHFSSFNNPPYLASVNETRQVSLKRDGSVQASRWCAGCHDPVPFFSGAFDDPEFDMLKHPTSQAGVTCTVCHAITHVNSARGNADYTIEEPLHYPFAYSDNSFLQWINNQLVKAKPSFHKKTFLKPFHKSAEFCSTCHKVHLPYALNHYKKFLRGQNHYDPYLLSGVSGHGIRSFYYPPVAKTNCNQCHMPLQASDDFGAQVFAEDGGTELSVHDHLFPTANTGIAWLLDRPEIIEAHREFLDGVMRVDIFGIREGGEIDGELIAPLRPEVPELVPGESYLLETVIRTLKLGHLFSQGTVDSNEIWLDVTVSAGDRVIGRSGAIDPTKLNEVDPWSHFVNVFMLDKDGNRIDRRNPQDIFTPLYNHQIPPGAGQTVHYGLTLPDDVDAPVTVEVKLQYRKFDTRYMEFVAAESQQLGRTIRGHEPGEPYVNELPIVTLATDRVTFPVAGIEAEVENSEVDFPLWQRWNDYGIGLLLKGKGQLRQAEEAFQQVEALDRWDGPMNLTRVYNTEGRLDEAVAALNRADAFGDEEGFPRWTWAWLSGDINLQNGNFEAAVNNLRSALDDSTPETRARKFDFRLDYQVRNQLGEALFQLGKQRARMGEDGKAEAAVFWQQAVEAYQQTLEADPENETAHSNLHQLFTELQMLRAEQQLLHVGQQKLHAEQQAIHAERGDEQQALEHEELASKAEQRAREAKQRADEHAQQASEHRALHDIFRPDDNAQSRAIRLAREKYPAANHAAEAVTIYPLQREGAPGLDAGATQPVNSINDGGDQ